MLTSSGLSFETPGDFSSFVTLRRLKGVQDKLFLGLAQRVVEGRHAGNRLAVRA